jgi:hypothetical protein
MLQSIEYRIIEKSHRFMGVGEGDNEMPEHLLEELRKRTIYYKSEMPKDIQVDIKTSDLLMFDIFA